MINRREFVVDSLFALSWTALGGARPLVAQQLPASAGAAAPELVDDLVAANRIPSPGRRRRCIWTRQRAALLVKNDSLWA